MPHGNDKGPEEGGYASHGQAGKEPAPAGAGGAGCWFAPLKRSWLVSVAHGPEDSRGHVF